MKKKNYNLHEPSSSITDLILSIVCFLWSYDLFEKYILFNSNILLLCSTFFFILAFGSFLGSFFHMFAKIISKKLIGFNMKLAIFISGLSILIISFIYIEIMIKDNLKYVFGFLFLLLIIFYFFSALSYKLNKSLIILIPIFIFIFSGILYEILNNSIGSKEIAIGFTIITCGLIIWKSGFSPHKYFNKNDIFHLISIIGLWYIYSGYKVLFF